MSATRRLAVTIREAALERDTAGLLALENASTQGPPLGIVAFSSLHVGGYAARARETFPESLICVAVAEPADCAPPCVGTTRSPGTSIEHLPITLSVPDDRDAELAADVEALRTAAAAKRSSVPPTGVVLGAGSIGIKSVFIQGRLVRCGVIFDLRVHPVARRLCIAQRITEALEAFAWARSAEFVYLSVNRGNTPAVTLYQHGGYTLCSKRSPATVVAALSGDGVVGRIARWLRLRAAERGIVAASAAAASSAATPSSTTPLTAVVPAPATSATGRPGPPLDPSVEIRVREVTPESIWAGLEAAWTPSSGDETRSRSIMAQLAAEPAHPGELAAVTSMGSLGDGTSSSSSSSSSTVPDMTPAALRDLIFDSTQVLTHLVAETGRVDRATGEWRALDSADPQYGRAQTTVVNGSTFGGMAMVSALWLPAEVWQDWRVTASALMLCTAAAGGAAWGLAAAAPQSWNAGLTGAGGTAVGAISATLLWSLWVALSVGSVTMVSLASLMARIVGAPSWCFDAEHALDPGMRARVPQVRARTLAPVCIGPQGLRAMAILCEGCVDACRERGFTTLISNMSIDDPHAAALHGGSFGTSFMWKWRTGTVAPASGVITPGDVFDPRDL